MAQARVPAGNPKGGQFAGSGGGKGSKAIKVKSARSGLVSTITRDAAAKQLKVLKKVLKGKSKRAATIAKSEISNIRHASKK